MRTSQTSGTPNAPAPQRRLRYRRLCAAVLAAGLSVSLVACTSGGGGGDTAGGDGPDSGETAMRKAPDACAVLKTDEVQKALGGVTSSGQPSTVDGIAACTWRPVGSMDPALALTVTVDTQKTVKSAVKAFDTSKPAGAEAISGVPAGYVDGNPPKAHLRVGNLIVTISLGNMADPKVRERLDAAAKAAAQNL